MFDAGDRMKVLDIMDSAVQEPRKHMRDNMPAVGRWPCILKGCGVV